MNRLEKKCVIASAAMHGLLLVIVLIGPAFLSSRKDAVDLPLLVVISGKVTDAVLSGGGNPNAKPPPAAQRIEQPQQPTPQRPKIERESTPRPPEPKPQAIKNPEQLRQEIKVTKDVSDKTAPPKREIKINKEVVKLNNKDEVEAKLKAQEEAKARAKAEADARRQRAEQAQTLLAGATRNLNKNLSSSTTIDMPGPVGAEIANYGQAVKSIYDQAWITPGEVSDDSATVQVKIVVARDGAVIADTIVKKSGIPALDKSVQDALDRVRSQRLLPAFPDGAKDGQRTFFINFNLKARRLNG